MPRFLTPSKIGLLALTSIYVNGSVPPSATVPVLSFLVSHLLPFDSLGAQPNGFVIPFEDFKSDSLSHPSTIPGRTVWDLLLKKLWDITSFEALHSLFDESWTFFGNILEATPDETNEHGPSRPGRIRLSMRSPLGAFVRRSQLEFTRLQFHDGIALWKAFATYREPKLSPERRRNPPADEHGFDVVDLCNRTNSGPSVAVLARHNLTEPNFQEAKASIDDFEKLLEFQVDVMQSTFQIILAAFWFVLCPPY